MFKKSFVFLLLVSLLWINLAFSKEMLVKIPCFSRETLEELQAFSIEEVGDGYVILGDGYVILYVTEEHLKILEGKGYSPEIIVADMQQYTLSLRKDSRGSRFTSYDNMVQDMQAVADSFPAIASLHNWGFSVDGRQILTMKISDNVDVNEDEPPVRILGCHHGNEQMSAEIPLELIHYLTENYGSDPTVTNLVDEREIWIGPMVNPDGHEVGSRYNSNSVDLNRDYGFMWKNVYTNGNKPYSQPEVRAIRQMGMENNFALSLSFHCSGDIINYVWNYTENAPPDHTLIHDLSVGYENATNNGYWIVQGAFWYISNGDTNDWAYGTRGCIDWTIETDNSNFSNVWNQNLDGILYIIEQAGMGVHGTVTDALTGAPVKGQVDVMEIRMPVYTCPEVGDYHRPLLPGTYTLKFFANGYYPTIIENVTVVDGTPTNLDVQLQPTSNPDTYAYNVVSAYGINDDIMNLPTEALGAPDTIPAPMGKGGWFVYDMGEDTEIYDNSGADFRVIEAMFPEDNTPEGYTVYGSNSYYDNWTQIGSGIGTTDFDLSGTGLAAVRYIKIVDDNDSGYSGEYGGFDLDAIQRISGGSTYIPDYTLNWGTYNRAYDLNGDSIVDTEDIQILISRGIYAIVPQNYPNPFNPHTNINYTLLKDESVELKIYDINGKLIKTFFNEEQKAGVYSVNWNGQDENGREVSSGVYFYQLNAGDFTEINKMTLLR